MQFFFCSSVRVGYPSFIPLDSWQFLTVIWILRFKLELLDVSDLEDPIGH